MSTNKQDLNNQKLAIMEYAEKHEIKIDEYVRIQISSCKSTKNRLIDQLISELEKGDMLIVYELSRIGRSLGQIIRIIDTLIRNGVRFVSLKERLDINGKQNIQTKVMVGLFGLFAEIERDLISERTKQGLIVARLKGKQIGRPKGEGKSKLDGKEKDIQHLINLDVSKSSIAKILGVSRGCLYKFIGKKKIKKR